jgi:hypothetical protein
MKNRLCERLAVAVVLSTSLPATGQTGRIAHLSHGGSTATLAAAVAADNFGLPTSHDEYATDSLVCLNDSLMMSYGRYRSVPWRSGVAELKKAPWQPSTEQRQYYSGPYHPQRWQEALQDLRRQYPQAKLIGFDKQLKKQGRKKSASQRQVFPKRPFQYSFWRGLAAVAGLGAVGWLLGRKSAA